MLKRNTLPVVDAKALRKAMHGKWHTVLPKFGIPSEALSGKPSICPFCSAPNSFVYPGYGNGWAICNGGCGVKGDAMTLIGEFTKIPPKEFPRLLRLIAERSGYLSFDEARPTKVSEPSSTTKILAVLKNCLPGKDGQKLEAICAKVKSFLADNAISEESVKNILRNTFNCCFDTRADGVYVFPAGSDMPEEF